MPALPKDSRFPPVTVYLRAPISSVCLRDVSTLRTAMKKAPVDKHRYPALRKHEVRRAGNVGWPHAPAPNALPQKQCNQPPFRRSISSRANRSHILAAALARRLKPRKSGSRHDYECYPNALRSDIPSIGLSEPHLSTAVPKWDSKYGSSTARSY